MSHTGDSKAARFALCGTLACGVMLGFVPLGPMGFAQEPQLPVAAAPINEAPVVAAEPIAGVQERLRVNPLKIPNTSIEGVGTSRTPVDSTLGRLPTPIPLPYGPDRDYGWTYSSKNWIAPVFFHQPTYYEDIMLENHGHERCPPLQPLLCGARFYSGLFFTPYLYCLDGPFEEVASVGRYRPGSIAPALRQRAPYDPYALGTQAVATGSGVLLLKP